MLKNKQYAFFAAFLMAASSLYAGADFQVFNSSDLGVQGGIQAQLDSMTSPYADSDGSGGKADFFRGIGKCAVAPLRQVDWSVEEPWALRENTWTRLTTDHCGTPAGILQAGNLAIVRKDRSGRPWIFLCGNEVLDISAANPESWGKKLERGEFEALRKEPPTFQTNYLTKQDLVDVVRELQQSKPVVTAFTPQPSGNCWWNRGPGVCTVLTGLGLITGGYALLHHHKECSTCGKQPTPREPPNTPHSISPTPTRSYGVSFRLVWGR